MAAEQARQIDARLQGALDRLTGLPPGAAELLGAKVELTTTAEIRPASELRITDLALEGEAATLGGTLGLSLPDDRLDGALSLSLPRLAALAPLLDQKLEGALDLDATLAGTSPAPEVELAARSGTPPGRRPRDREARPSGRGARPAGRSRQARSSSP